METTIKDRVKELRKGLNLTMEEFGIKLGIGKGAISNIESGRRNPSDQLLKSICREFRIEEDWLRTGQGSMYRSDTGSILERMAQEYHFTELERAVFAAYLKLSDRDRAAIERYLTGLVEEITPSVKAEKEDLEARVAALEEEGAGEDAGGAAC